MPKAKPYPDADEQEPTHMQSQWEEEASTTVEQGEVANKVRALEKANGHTGHTDTGAGLDEPTVDDRDAPVLSAITPLKPDTNARLIITAGNDAGREIEIRTGKTWTIGRGLDNDVVLTDIAVSRKHFDLKFEDGAWIIVDRGSGNGTVVNGNVEDNPFMLASGDHIEIGNTVFRYEQPNGVPRPAAKGGFEDDEEMSTVAGKPVRAEPTEDLPPARPARPKTLPPPVPLRPAHASAPPPSYTQPPQLPPLPPAQLPPLPQSTLPMPQMSNRPPIVGPGSPTMLGDAMGMPVGVQSGNFPLGTTIPGQGAGSSQRPSPSSFPYPQAQEIPPHSVHAQMLLIQTQNRRGDGSTAHVPPAPYDPMLYMGGAQQRGVPQLSRRTKLVVAVVGLALLTGIVTAAVLKSGPAKGKPATSAKKDAGKKDGALKTEKTKPTAVPIDVAKGSDAAKGNPTVADSKTPTVTKTVTDPKTEAKTTDTKTTDTRTTDTRTTDTKTADAKAAEAKAQADATAADAKARADAKAQAAADKKAADDAKAADRKAAAEAKAAEAKRVADAKAAERAKKQEARDERDKRRREARREASSSTSSSEKRVATATDTSGARERAEGLYTQKKFNAAADVLSSAAKGADEDEADDLRDKANKLRALQTAYNKANVPAQSPTITFAALQQAINMDNQVWGNFKSELKDKLATVAPKAAVAFVAKKEYGSARTAYLAAKAAGSTDANLPLVNQKLEAFANELYALASKQASSDPGPAREKLKQIKSLVDAKSPIAVKAQALLNKL